MMDHHEPLVGHVDFLQLHGHKEKPSDFIASRDRCVCWVRVPQVCWI